MKKNTARKHPTKVHASVVLVAGAASVAGLGTFGAFISTTAASEAVSAGHVEINLTKHAALGTALDLGAATTALNSDDAASRLRTHLG